MVCVWLFTCEVPEGADGIDHLGLGWRIGNLFWIFLDVRTDAQANLAQLAVERDAPRGNQKTGPQLVYKFRLLQPVSSVQIKAFFHLGMHSFRGSQKHETRLASCILMLLLGFLTSSDDVSDSCAPETAW